MYADEVCYVTGSRKKVKPVFLQLLAAGAVRSCCIPETGNPHGSLADR
jgi:hypothetical protein